MSLRRIALRGERTPVVCFSGRPVPIVQLLPTGQRDLGFEQLRTETQGAVQMLFGTLQRLTRWLRPEKREQAVRIGQTGMSKRVVRICGERRLIMSDALT